MGQLINRLALLAVLAGGATAALGQRSVEIFIPIGQSPGLSGKHTLIARVQAYDGPQKTIAVVDAKGAVATVRANPQTRVWLDRSQLGLPNRQGDFQDCRPDRMVEIKYHNNDTDAAPLDWIKGQALE